MDRKLLLVFAFAFAIHTNAQTPTWSEDIAPIIYSNCSNCHNVHGIAPFELMSYADAVFNASEIKDEVADRKMPPWPPDPSFSRLAHERVLTQQQINDIVDWVDNGMPRGDSLLEPQPPVISTSVEITNPDLVLSAPVYNVNTTDDLYRCFVIPSTLLSDKFITAIEAIPGNRNVVHHILIYSDTTNIPSTLDALSPGPGYTNFGGTGSIYSKLIGVWVPGQGAYYAPAGMGIKLPANCNIVMQIHYPGGISGQVDSTKLSLKLTSNFQREIGIESPLNHYQLDNGPLIIPANTTRTFTAHYTVPYDVSLLGIGPHMHLIGRSILSYGITPTNDTIPFIDIPEWDFHWQGVYSFPRVLKIPLGTVLYSSAFYDNTAANPENPNSPPQTVTLGEATTDEMMLVYFAYIFYLPGDENIIIDSTFYTGIQPIQNSAIATPQLYDLVPNPVIDNLQYQYFLPHPNEVSISILDLHGKLILEANGSGKVSGLYTSNLNVSALPAGIYFLVLKTDGVIRSKKFVKN